VTSVTGGLLLVRAAVSTPSATALAFAALAFATLAFAAVFFVALFAPVLFVVTIRTVISVEC
jgi:hypothetical protein